MSQLVSGLMSEQKPNGKRNQHNTADYSNINIDSDDGVEECS